MNKYSVPNLKSPFQIVEILLYIGAFWCISVFKCLMFEKGCLNRFEILYIII